MNCASHKAGKEKEGEKDGDILCNWQGKVKGHYHVGIVGRNCAPFGGRFSSVLKERPGSLI